MTRDLLLKVCALSGKEIHLVLDGCMSSSIKDLERELRSSKGTSDKFVISGPNKCSELVESQMNLSFKKQFSCYIMKEWRKEHYGSIIGVLILYGSHGGKCSRYLNQEYGGNIQLGVGYRPQFQSQHAEANTLVGFHAKQIGVKSKQIGDRNKLLTDQY